MLKDGTIVEIPAGKPARTPKQLFGTKRQRRLRAIRCAAIRFSVVLAAVLMMAALATPGEPGYQPQYASGLVVTVIVCAGWIGLVWYANSDVRRRAERSARRREQIRRAGKAAGMAADREAVRETAVQSTAGDKADVQGDGTEAGRNGQRQLVQTGHKNVQGKKDLPARVSHGQRVFCVDGAGISKQGSCQMIGQRT